MCALLLVAAPVVVLVVVAKVLSTDRVVVVLLVVEVAPVLVAEALLVGAVKPMTAGMVTKCIMGIDTSRGVHWSFARSLRT